MTEPVEKIKRKAKPRTDRYSQNEAFAVIVFSLAMMLFFWLDELIGAVVLKQYEVFVSFCVAIIVPFIFVQLMGQWGYLSNHMAWLLSVIASVIAGIFFFGYLIFVTLFSGIPCAPVLFFIVILFAASIFTKPNDTESEYEDHFWIKGVTLIALVCTFFIALAVTNTDTTYNSITYARINDHDYHILRKSIFDWDGNRLTLELYECNQISINCELAFHQLEPFLPSLHGLENSVIEVTQGDHDNVLVLVNGEVVFESSE
ncbi:MAG: hypothetical protein H6670_01875 [Anaerolineaceae bacterium]|nr:hypothetical protein [Anaerolineaceae bacterium]